MSKNKKAIGLFKDELGGNFMTELVALRAKAYTYSMENGSEHKKAKGTKKCVIKLQFIQRELVLWQNHTKTTTKVLKWPL